MKQKLTPIEKVAMPIFGIVICGAIAIIFSSLHTGLKQGKTMKQIITEQK